MELDYKKLAQEKKEDILHDLQELIAIDSSEDLAHKSEKYPLGPGPAKALEKFLHFAKRDGFDTENFDNYAGRINMGDGKERVGVIGHVDVVPAGDGWKTDPFKMTIKDGKIYGRGSADDKGPALAAYYGMLILKEHGFKPSKKIDFVLGTNEETNWVGIDYYLKHQPAPDVAFSPDAEFPIINGEQGIVTLKLDFKDDFNEGDVKVWAFNSGTAANVIPHTAHALIESDDLNSIKQKYEEFLKQHQLDGNFELHSGQAELTLIGHGAHASAPATGKNAATFLALFLDSLNLDGQVKNFIHFIANIEHEDFDGKKLGIAHHDDLMGDLVSSPSVFKLDAQNAYILNNVRFPKGTDGETMVNQINDKFGDILTAHIQGRQEDPHYVPGDDPIVKTLLGVYEKQTGKKGHEVIIGGGTYGRLFDHGVAFGAQAEGAPLVMHQPNEYMTVEDLINSIAIYAEAIYELSK
ncbi:dipeptidase PepV [Lactobacillus sp. PV037]|uniref:dipeptidase PepV n=1 Tax=unclassified Lactobacillus TaxID=2620435 RepID=UPI00223EA8C8|nr:MULTISPECIES: dipeptidase PepV [unclassified Lactobacillus]QNQ81926.1 dipeptidase PepV [Lactobacillus sp. PV012]QNQ84038.1 dipeptidase PepV [Lactobacillus sp. PV037]